MWLAINEHKKMTMIATKFYRNIFKTVEYSSRWPHLIQQLQMRAQR